MPRVWIFSFILFSCFLESSHYLVAQDSKPKESTSPKNSDPKELASQEAPHERMRKMLDRAISERKRRRLVDLFDIDAFIELVFDGTKIDVRTRQIFMNGFQETGVVRIFDEILNQIEQGASYQWVRNIEEKNGVRLLYRLLPFEGGVPNYHEWKIGVKGNQPALQDCFVHFSGDYISVSMRNGVLATAASQNKGILGNWFGGNENDFVEVMMKSGELNENGDHQAALKVLVSSRCIHKNRAVAIMALKLAQTTSEEDVNQVTKQIRKDFPNELRLVTLQLQNGEEALASLDELIIAIKDPYLYALKVPLLCDLGRLDDASKAMSIAFESCSDLILVHWTRVELSLWQKRYDLTAQYLDQIKSDFLVEMEDLHAIPVYKDFLESKEGKEWLEKSKK